MKYVEYFFVILGGKSIFFSYPVMEEDGGGEDDYFGWLSTEVLLYMFSFLKHPELVAISSTCKSFQALGKFVLI